MAISIVFLGIQVFQILDSKEKSRQNLSDLNNKISDLADQNSKLEREINNSHEEEYLETQARIKLNYKLQDEQVVFVYKNDKEAQEGETTENNKVKTKPRYLKWLDWLNNF